MSFKHHNTLWYQNYLIEKERYKLSPDEIDRIMERRIELWLLERSLENKKKKDAL